MKNLRTDLIIHHCIANVLDHAAELIRVLRAVYEPLGFASLPQWSEFSKNVLQFPSNL